MRARATVSQCRERWGSRLVTALSGVHLNGTRVGPTGSFGDPLTDVRVFEHVSFVLKSGVVVLSQDWPSPLARGGTP